MTKESTVLWKGIAITLIVLQHLELFPLGGGELGVIIFLVISGYGLSVSKNSRF